MSDDAPSEVDERRLRMAVMQTEIELNRAQTDLARATLEQIRATVDRMEVEARWEPWKALAAIVAASAAMVGVVEALFHLHG
ncbi:MAG: hypothetical protein JO047_12960 [Alphaproteobacteria bacterium]|nr:hypothetical protein [Alphaproteobacteria bacterium]